MDSTLPEGKEEQNTHTYILYICIYCIYMYNIYIYIHDVETYIKIYGCSYGVSKHFGP